MGLVRGWGISKRRVDLNHVKTGLAQQPSPAR